MDEGGALAAVCAAALILSPQTALANIIGGTFNGQPIGVNGLLGGSSGSGSGSTGSTGSGADETEDEETSTSDSSSDAEKEEKIQSDISNMLNGVTSGLDLPQFVKEVDGDTIRLLYRGGAWSADNMHVTTNDGEYYQYIEKEVVKDSGSSTTVLDRIEIKLPTFPDDMSDLGSSMRSGYVEMIREKIDDYTARVTFKAKDDGSVIEEYTMTIERDGFCEHGDYSEWKYNVWGHWLTCAVCGEKAPDWMGSKVDTIYDGSLGHTTTNIRKIVYQYSWGSSDNLWIHTCGVCGAQIAHDGVEKKYRTNEDGERSETDYTIVHSEEDIQELIAALKGRFENGAKNPSSGDEALEADENSEEAQNSTPVQSANSTAPNGYWQQDVNGWWFVKNEGGYPTDSWYECKTANGAGWYHFDAVGYMNNGWFTDKDGNTYYLDKNPASPGYGAMLTGWQWIDGKCYYLNPSSGYAGYPAGALLKNTAAPDGYTVNAAGEWVVNGVVQMR